MVRDDQKNGSVSYIILHRETIKREEEELKKEIARLNKKRKEREDDVEREKKEKPGAVEYRERMAKYKRAKVTKKDREYDVR